MSERRVGWLRTVFQWTFLAVLGCPAGDVAAQGVTVALRPTTPVVAPGAEFDVELRVTKAGAVFNGFDAVVTYDPAALTFIPLAPTSLQQGALMTDSCGNTFHRFRAGAGADTISDVLLCHGVSLSGPGTIYRLHFKASTVAQITSLQFTPGTLKFYNAGLFVTPVTSQNAQVGIGVDPTAVDGNPSPPTLSFSAAPNPSRGVVVFTSAPGATGPESLTVRDVQGRVVRRLSVAAGRASWDARRETGEPAPDGIYFATLESSGRATTIRFSLTR